jgi:hypothetical protein
MRVAWVRRSFLLLGMHANILAVACSISVVVVPSSPSIVVRPFRCWMVVFCLALGVAISLFRTVGLGVSLVSCKLMMIL